MNAPASSTGSAAHGLTEVDVCVVVMAAMLPPRVRSLNYLGGKCRREALSVL
jgi:hypothetical protein